jgi:tetratricopeptide (TPR) repeat protein
MVVDPQLQFAAQLISNGYINEAKQIITQVIKVNDKNADAWYLAASIMEDPARQIQALERALTINPQHERAKRALAQLRSTPAAPTVAPRQPIDQSARSASARSMYDTYLKQSEIAQAHEDSPGALNALSQALRIEPDSAEVYVQRGRIYHKNKQIAEAIADFKEALRLDPHHPQATKLREFVDNAQNPDWMAYQEGLKSCDEGNYSRAIDQFNDAIKRNGKIAVYYLGRANAYQERGNVSAALSDLDKAVRFAPKAPEIWMARGKARALKENFNGAISDFSQALKLEESAEGYLERGKAESAKENFKTALKDLSQAITLDPELAEAFGYRGLARFHLKDVAGAYEDYLAAVALEPAQIQATELLLKIERSKQRKK